MTFNGLEALLRWQHPTTRRRGPRRLHPAPRGDRHDRPGGPRGARAGLPARRRRWHQRGFPGAGSPSTSRRCQLESDDFVDDVRRALHETGLDPEALTLEITESALMRDAERRGRAPASLEGTRYRARDRRLRDRLLLALLPAPIPDRRAEDRPVLREWHGRPSRGRDCARAHDGAAGPGAAAAHRGRGDRDRGDSSRLLQAEGCVDGQGFLFARPVSGNEVERFFGRSLQQFGRSRPTSALAPPAGSGRPLRASAARRSPRSVRRRRSARRSG